MPCNYSYRQVGDHDDDEDVLLPDHPPEGLAGLVERALRADVCVEAPEAVDEVAVDVVGRLLLTRQRSQHHAAVVV